MHSFPIKVNGDRARRALNRARIIVRPNYDGWAVWYVFLLINGVESDIPEGFNYIHGDIDVGFDVDPELFARAEKDALAVAQQVLLHYDSLENSR